MKPPKALLDAHSEFFNAAGNSIESSLRKLVDIVNNPLTTKKAPGIILDFYCQTRVSLSTSSHANVLYAFQEALELARRKPSRAYTRSLIQLLVKVMKSSPKKSLLAKIRRDHEVETERLLMNFHDEKPLAFEDRALAERENWTFIRKLRLLSSILSQPLHTDPKRTFGQASTLFFNIMTTARAPSRHLVLKTLEGDHAKTTVSMLSAATSAIYPSYPAMGPNAVELTKKISSGRLNLVLWTLYQSCISEKITLQITTKNSTKKSTKDDAKIDELHQRYFPLPKEHRDVVRKEMDDRMAYMFETLESFL